MNEMEELDEEVREMIDKLTKRGEKGGEIVTKNGTRVRWIATPGEVEVRR